MSAARRIAPGIRAKVLFASSALLLVPWIGYAFVTEMERFLSAAQARMLADNARAVAALVAERAAVTPADTQRVKPIAPPLLAAPRLDGAVDDWVSQGADIRAYGAERLVELRKTWTTESLSFTHATGVQGDKLFAFFDVSDDRVVYCAQDSSVDCDHVRISLQRSGGARQRYVLTAPGPGVVRVLSFTEAAEPIEGYWRERKGGYVVELRLPAYSLQQLGFAVADVDEPGAGVNAVIATEDYLAQERARFDITPDVAAILEGMARAKLRIWLVDSGGGVVMRTGQLEGAEDPLSHSSRLDAPEIQSALSGHPALRTHERSADGPVINAAAYPVQSGGETIGAALVEQTSVSIDSMRTLALDRLLVATVAAFVGGALILLLYVTHLSHRLRRLRDEAERAIDSAGRVRTLAAGSTARDEIGDLSRSYSAVLKRLAQYTDYLENLARRLNHELRTPIAVVRSSLDNLRSQTLPSDSTVYLERAEAGLDRLAAILSRMSEATRLEEIMGHAERETFDLDEVVSGCAEGYRLAYAPLEIRYRGPPGPLKLTGVPDLIAQMLDKLVENAAEHAEPGTPVEIALEDEGREAVLRVRNEGPPLPAAMEGRLFDSMVSVQESGSSATPHLGLGLYIVKLIAQFHGGAPSAANRGDKPGVEVTVRLAL